MSLPGMPLKNLTWTPYWCWLLISSMIFTLTFYIIPICLFFKFAGFLIYVVESINAGRVKLTKSFLSQPIFSLRRRSFSCFFFSLRARFSSGVSRAFIISFCFLYQRVTTVLHYYENTHYNTHHMQVMKALKCKPSANCACAILLIDGLGYLYSWSPTSSSRRV